jgi:hypothetical protein
MGCGRWRGVEAHPRHQEGAAFHLLATKRLVAKIDEQEP